MSRGRRRENTAAHSVAHVVSVFCILVYGYGVASGQVCLSAGMRHDSAACITLKYVQHTPQVQQTGHGRSLGVGQVRPAHNNQALSLADRVKPRLTYADC